MTRRFDLIESARDFLNERDPRIYAETRYEHGWIVTVKRAGIALTTFGPAPEDECIAYLTGILDARRYIGD
jgi:hypothetical protein